MPGLGGPGRPTPGQQRLSAGRRRRRRGWCGRRWLSLLQGKGALYRDYPASLDDNAAAVRPSLAETQFPLSPRRRRREKSRFTIAPPTAPKSTSSSTSSPAASPSNAPPRASPSASEWSATTWWPPASSIRSRAIVPGGTAVPPPPGVAQPSAGRFLLDGRAPLAAPTSGRALTDLGARGRKPWSAERRPPASSPAQR